MRWTPPAIVGRSSLYREDVKRVLKNAQSTIARYKGSRQTQVYLKDRYEGVMTKRMVILQDVPINKVTIIIYIGQAAGVLQTYHQAGRDSRAQHFSTDGRSGLGDLGEDLYRVDTFSEDTKASGG